jgi:superfamily II DNA or RNA helicase
MIALLLIQKMADAFEQGKQTVFLVPSVALAIQQEAVLKAHLPEYTIGSVHGAAVYSEAKLANIKTCNIVVATHGACLEMLQSYSLKVENWNLLILDECHNCRGKNPYATVMTYYYRAEDVPADKRPRVLGLTASPLINVTPDQSDSQLEENLRDFERLMNARIVSLEQLGLADDDKDVLAARPCARLTRVPYWSTDWSGFDERLRLNVDSDPFQLHPVRLKELTRFKTLYEDLGPLPVKLYVNLILQDIKRNTFEDECPMQFERAKLYLGEIVSFCSKVLEDTPEHWVSAKLCTLEDLLQREMEDSGCSGGSVSGVVFVKERITAMALEVYFSHRGTVMSESKPWPPNASSCDNRERQAPTKKPIASPASVATNIFDTFGRDTSLGAAVLCDQFMDPNECMDGDECIGNARDAPVKRDVTRTEECEDAEDEEDQFGDADSFDDPFFDSALTIYNVPRPEVELAKTPPRTDPNDKKRIRCGSLVRNQTGIFKALRLPTGEHSGEGRESKRLRTALNDFRSGKLNLLIATSIIEEGVDVPACSFVVGYDGLTTLKNFVQMKGRARTRDAKFFVFENPAEKSSSLSLADAQAVEDQLARVLRSRLPSDMDEFDLAWDPGHSEDDSDDESGEIEDPELRAAVAGLYRAAYVLIKAPLCC